MTFTFAPRLLTLAALLLQPAASAAQDGSLWIDPAWQDTTARAIPSRVILWFDRQLLAGGDAYVQATARLANARGRALRTTIVDSLKRMSNASWERARPVLAPLEQQGVIARCERHWVVNSVTCEIHAHDVRRLNEVPGAFRAFRSDARASGGMAAPASSVGCAPATDTYQPDPARAPWNTTFLGVDRVWREFGISGRGVLHVVHDFGWTLAPPPILATLWCNPGEIAGNGRDDDNNGYVDDVHGFNADQGDQGLIGGGALPGGGTHGDLTAALLAGRELTDTTLIVGVAPGSRWAAVLSNRNIEGGIEWALTVGANTYSMSFSMANLGELRGHWRRVTEHAALAGLFLVSGAGNFAAEGSPNYAPVPVQMRIPEDIPLAVFGVSGVGRDGRRPPFSSQGPVRWETVDYREGLVQKPDFAATNINLIAPDTLGRVATTRGPSGWAGNSFAGPQTAGVIALMLEADPDLTPWVARRILVETARDVEPAGVDHQTGAGVIDAYRAVGRVKERLAARR